MARKRKETIDGVVEFIRPHDAVNRVHMPIYKNCYFCGRQIMVNNYEDGKPRTPRFNGKVICPWCDPRTLDRKAVRSEKLDQYKTIMSRLFLEKILEYKGREDDLAGDELLVWFDRIDKMFKKGT